MNSTRVQTVIFDFSRVILFPKDPNYSAGLNALHRTLSSENPSYAFLDNFELNVGLLDFLKNIKNISFYIFTTGYIQDSPAIKNELNQIFKAVYSADKLGVTKSDPRTYVKLCAEINVEPASVLFIDDTASNVRAASLAGLQTYQYTDNQSLKDFFRRQHLA